MSEARGRFVWYELLTTDTASATEFYGSVIGWTVTSAGIDRPYFILTAGDTAIGGLLDLPPEALDMGARPNWIAYIGVSDVDDFVARVAERGGGVFRAAESIPAVGRFAVVHDPQGAAFVLFTPEQGMQAPAAAPPGTPGHIGWHELHAADRETAFTFYAELFGWTKAEAVDMGPMGIYQLFATGGPAIGGMMTKTESVPVPAWLYYINVVEIEAAVDRVKAAGGQLINGPHQVPGGSWIAQCVDPQGAVFAMVAAPAPV